MNIRLLAIAITFAAAPIILAQTIQPSPNPTATTVPATQSATQPTTRSAFQSWSESLRQADTKPWVKMEPKLPQAFPLRPWPLAAQIHPAMVKSANQGNAGAQYYMGAAYDKGFIVPQDQSIAFNWYRQAAEQGHPAAQFQLGKCYDEGKGIMKDPIAALKWYKKSADQGNPEAQKALKALQP